MCSDEFFLKHAMLPTFLIFTCAPILIFKRVTVWQSLSIKRIYWY